MKTSDYKVEITISSGAIAAFLQFTFFYQDIWPYNNAFCNCSTEVET